MINLGYSMRIKIKTSFGTYLVVNGKKERFEFFGRLCNVAFFNTMAWRWLFCI